MTIMSNLTPATDQEIEEIEAAIAQAPPRVSVPVEVAKKLLLRIAAQERQIKALQGNNRLRH